MGFKDLDKKEKYVLYASVFLVLVVFSVSLYHYFNPPTRVLEAKVFDAFQDRGNTVIWTYGEDKITLKGIHDIEIEEIYRITYRGRRENFADVIISIEKIS